MPTPSTVSGRGSGRGSNPDMSIFDKTEQDPLNASEPRKWSVDLPTPYPQLTFKAVIGGCLVGIICSFLALYYSLKTGVVPSLNILSGLGGFVLVKGGCDLLTRFGKSYRFTPQENAVLQTAAVATYSSSCPGAGFASGYLAMGKSTCELLKWEGDNCETDSIGLTWVQGLVWCLALAFFGFFIAFPLREYCVLKQRLFFPSGTATAYVIKTMHQSAGQAAKSFAVMSKFFSIAFVVNIVTWVFNGLTSLPIFGLGAASYGWQCDFDLGTIGIGLLLNNKINFSLAAGGIVAHGILRPLLDYYARPAWYSFEPPSPYLGSLAYTLFGGLGIMIVQGFFSIVALVWVLFNESSWGKKCLEKCSGKEKSEQGKEETVDDPERLRIMDEVFYSSKIPVWIPPVGYLTFSAICIVVMHFMFKTPWYQVLVALIIIPIFAVSNIQGIGRTDWDVSSSYGKLIMFPFGAWNRSTGSVLPSLALCIITISGCSNAGTLMQDFKTGYLLGSSPSIMFVAQSIGQLWGCFVTPTLFHLLTAAFPIPSDEQDAFITGLYGPIYRTLGLIATTGGWDQLPKNALAITGAFCLFALALDLCEILLPDQVVDYFPDGTAFGIGVLIPATPSLNFLLGAGIRTFWTYFDPATCKERTAYVASGLVAGSGIAVVLQCLATLAGLHSPILVAWSSEPRYKSDDIKWWTWLGMIVMLIATFAVLYCGLRYWYEEGRILPEKEEKEKAVDTAEEEVVRKITVHARKLTDMKWADKGREGGSTNNIENLSSFVSVQ